MGPASRDPRAVANRQPKPTEDRNDAAIAASEDQAFLRGPDRPPTISLLRSHACSTPRQLTWRRSMRGSPADRMVAMHRVSLDGSLAPAQRQVRWAADAQSRRDRRACQHAGRGHQGLPGGLGIIAQPSSDVHRIAEQGDLTLRVASLADDDRPRRRGTVVRHRIRAYRPARDLPSCLGRRRSSAATGRSAPCCRAGLADRRPRCGVLAFVAGHQPPEGKPTWWDVEPIDQSRPSVTTS